VAAEVTRDRNQKTESAEKEGGKRFWVYEINEDFRLMARAGLPAAFWFLALSRVRRGLIKGEIPLYALGDCLPPIGRRNLARHPMSQCPLWISNFTKPSSRIFNKSDWQAS
jgi:hypothetical protein